MCVHCSSLWEFACFALLDQAMMVIKNRPYITSHKFRRTQPDLEQPTILRSHIIQLWLNEHFIHCNAYTHANAYECVLRLTILLWEYAVSASNPIRSFCVCVLKIKWLLFFSYWIHLIWWFYMYKYCHNVKFAQQIIKLWICIHRFRYCCRVFSMLLFRIVRQ